MTVLLLAGWLLVARVVHWPADQAGPALVLVQTELPLPAASEWGRMAREAACAYETGAVKVWLLVNVEGEPGERAPAPFHGELVECPP